MNLNFRNQSWQIIVNNPVKSVVLAVFIIGLVMPAIIALSGIEFWPFSLAGNFIHQAMFMAAMIAVFWLFGAAYSALLIAGPSDPKPNDPNHNHQKHGLQKYSLQKKKKQFWLYFPFFLFLAISCLNSIAIIMATPFPLHTAQPLKNQDQSATELRIIHANLWGKSSALEKLIKWIDQKNPDIIALTELPGGVPESDILNPLFKTYPWRTFSVIGGPTRTLILSRFEIIRSAPSIDSAADAHIIIPNIGELHLVSIHPPPPLNPFLDFRRNRILENSFRHLGQDLKTSRHSASILVGDFNAVPWTNPLRRLSRENNMYRVNNDKLKNTWLSPHPFLGLPIDHIYSTDHFAMVHYETGPSTGSDHYPILVDLRPVAD